MSLLLYKGFFCPPVAFPAPANNEPAPGEVGTGSALMDLVLRSILYFTETAAGRSYWFFNGSGRSDMVVLSRKNKNNPRQCCRRALFLFFLLIHHLCTFRYPEKRFSQSAGDQSSADGAPRQDKANFTTSVFVLQPVDTIRYTAHQTAENREYPADGDLGRRDEKWRQFSRPGMIAADRNTCCQVLLRHVIVCLVCEFHHFSPAALFQLIFNMNVLLGRFVLLEDASFEQFVDQLFHGVEGAQESLRGHDDSDGALGNRGFAFSLGLEGHEVKADHCACEMNLSDTVCVDFFLSAIFSSPCFYWAVKRKRCLYALHLPGTTLPEPDLYCGEAPFLLLI